ncbi:amidohydrolase [Pseudonocardia sp. N23]|uniref:amidohydrolase n=1 Tax=Pseudonocardia sp. N23 TaxID=1987376 RepID=UPI000BFD04CD|nr:amidohydrolase family protein [Pseudonocardia sp. N23]GAY07391.1 exoenzymes regulatory protein AepA precursor [Pseudonocardia sp. N23]
MTSAAAARTPHPDTCSCHADPERFVAMVAEFDRARRAAAGLHWTEPAPITHPLQWSCSAQLSHPVVLQVFDEAAAGSAVDTPADAVTAAVAGAVSADLGRSPATAGRPRPERFDGTTVISGGRVFTGDGDAPWAEAVAFEGGRIVAVGTTSAMHAQFPGARVVDVGGRLVVPGLNDAHMHHTPDPAGVRLPTDAEVDPTREALLAAIGQAVAATPPGTWLFGTMGMSLITDESLDRTVLDRTAPDHPVILLGMTNHTNVLNSAALTRLGIDATEPVELGGSLERDAGGRPNGRIHEYAQWRPQRTFAAMATTEEGAASVRALSDECLRYGVTTIQNMSWTPPLRYLEMAAAADVPLRIRVIDFPATGAGGRFPTPPLSDRAAAAAPGAGRLEWSGRKWILDGTPVEAAAWMDYPGREGRGVQNFPATEVDGMLADSVSDTDQLLLHAIGTDAVEIVVDALDRSPDAGWGDRHLRIEHADGATPEQIARLRGHGAMIVQNPCHFLLTDMYTLRFGAEHGYSSFRSLFDAGIGVGIGSDGPLNPYLGMLAAVLHPTRPAESVDVATVLAAYTAGSATAEGAENEKGRLSPGYVADLAVLSQDLFAIAPELLPATRSVLTVIEGQIEWDALGDEALRSPAAGGQAGTAGT